MEEFNFDFRAVKNGAPIVTLSSFGIAFNELSRKYLGFPEEICMGYDSQKKAVGIKPYQGEDNLPRFKFESKARNGWIRIGCKEFMRYLARETNLDFLTKGLQFSPEMSSDKKLLIIIVDEQHLNK